MRPGQRPDKATCERLLYSQFPKGEVPDVGWLVQCLDLFEQSPLCAEMAAAAARGQLFHEVPFDVQLPAARWAVDGDRGPLWLSGRIDALFCDDDGKWVVVDYKLTKAQAVGELAGTYAKQLAAYRLALEAAGIGPIGRLGLWLAGSGQAVWVANS